ncbi:MAG: hypothetical protein MUE97_06050 [Phycisphaerales bacterium]|jgi:hypothetical protein|nr:hypothetical protein [Phycisphaerales bacterium]
MSDERAGPPIVQIKRVPRDNAAIVGMVGGVLIGLILATTTILGTVFSGLWTGSVASYGVGLTMGVCVVAGHVLVRKYLATLWDQALASAVSDDERIVIGYLRLNWSGLMTRRAMAVAPAVGAIRERWPDRLPKVVMGSDLPPVAAEAVGETINLWDMPRQRSEKRHPAYGFVSGVLDNFIFIVGVVLLSWGTVAALASSGRGASTYQWVAVLGGVMVVLGMSRWSWRNLTGSMMLLEPGRLEVVEPWRLWSSARSRVFRPQDSVMVCYRVTGMSQTVFYFHRVDGASTSVEINDSDQSTIAGEVLARWLTPRGEPRG